MSTGPRDRDAQIVAFVRSARAAVNRRLLVHTLAWSALSTFLAAALVGVGYVVAGHSVPIVLYPLALVALAVVTIVAWLARRVGESVAAGMVDAEFELQDGVRTAVAVERRGAGSGFESLQLHWATSRVSGLRLDRLGVRTRPAVMAGAAVALLLAVGLGFAPESEAVAKERADRAATAALAEELNEGVRQAVEEEIAEADEDELAEIDPSALRQMVDELEVSDEQADLLRQYGEMEQALAERSADAASPSVERLLREAAVRLADAPETAQLSKALEQQRFNDAAEEIEKFRQTAPVDESELRKKRADLDRLQRLARRLSDSARRTGAKGADGVEGELSDRESVERSGESLRDAAEAAIQELQQAADDLERSLSECKSGQCEASELDELARCSSCANSALSKLSETLRKVGAKQSAQERLSRLRQTLAQCQSAVAGQCQNPFASGQSAGQGSVQSENDGITREDGQLMELSAGARADGPARTTIEDASSGDGISGAGQRRVSEEFTRQLEAFVERPDVPEAVKEGVKLYLEGIHRTNEDEDENGAQDL